MRSIFLSFSPEWYQYIVSGEKIYEHRKRFTNEPVAAYLYLGLPVQKIVAVLELGKRIDMNDWLEIYKNNPDTINRIQASLKRKKYAMEIKSVQFIEPIAIKDVIKEFPQFHIPQSFFYLDNKKDIFEFISNRIVPLGEKKYNDFSKIDANIICRY